MKIRLELGTPTSPPRIVDFLSQSLAEANDLRVRLGFAFVSLPGVNLLLNSLKRNRQWRDAHKSWIVGLGQGISDPFAIDLLRRVPNSSVKMFCGGTELKPSSLAGSAFHAKTIIVDDVSRRNASGLWIGSANLTKKALVENCNFEACMCLLPGQLSLAETSLRQLDVWWENAEQYSVNATDLALQTYRDLRRLFSRDAVAVGIEKAEVLDIEEAAGLWFDAGSMSGGSRNQAEFSAEMASFFGPTTHEDRVVKIWYDTPHGRLDKDCGLRFRHDRSRAPIWRLGLPTEYEQGPFYPEQIICLMRRPDSDNEYFLEVAPKESTPHHQWRLLSNGHISSTSGKREREFGFFEAITTNE
jgi:HKD family nuclease